MPKNTTLDCRGLDCPTPVLLVRECMEATAPAVLRVLVDNLPAAENVTRLLHHYGYVATVTETEGVWELCAQRHSGEESPPSAATTKPSFAAAMPKPLAPEDAHNGKTLVVIPCEGFGQGDEVLAQRLMLNFLATLPEMGNSLWRVVLLNGGVRLAATEGPALESLQRLEREGVDVLVCGACLEFFKLTKEKKVGQTTNMLDIVTSMQLAAKVVRI
ncbi:sulfurtransferase-like selenium metabolism protein YedF [Desulfovibrio cuneatus]|uniref:sulfurtransferase-like selenium metabolism protein YedF n=1 Tax=Desulfovibrio cuneatus TaxID=159728 RepID=UPI0004078E46|nr:sulfurtransferase-like selenium metabolism protein YedF [Desulfovibrio cuneatus]